MIYKSKLQIITLINLTNHVQFLTLLYIILIDNLVLININRLHYSNSTNHLWVKQELEHMNFH